MIMAYIFINLIIFFLSSMLLNFTLLNLIKLDLFGKDFKSLPKHLIDNKPNLFCLILFILSLIILVYLKNFALFLTGNKDETCNVLSELDKVDPFWKDKFIHSPLELNTSLTQFVLESLNIHFLLNIIIIYLLIMLLFIFLCKLVLNQNTEFNNLNKYPLGNLINRFLVKYINMWQTSGNV